MYKFFAAQDQKKEAIGYSMDYLHSMLDMTEFIRFGYHQKVTPDLLAPDDMLHIFKNLVAESVDMAKGKTDEQSKQNQTSGMIDFTSFQKAIVRISALAQEKLGGTNDDLLKKKLDSDAQAKAKEDEKKKELRQQAKEREAKNKDELEKLREQFKEEQKYKDENLSKVKGDAGEKKGGETLVAQKRREEKQYELDSAALQQEEQFFQKWLKQRENLGLDKAGLSNKGDDAASARGDSIKKAKAKDATQKELDAMNKKLKNQAKMSKLEIEDKTLSKPVDVSIISADTIEAFFSFLGLNEQDSEYATTRKLTNNAVSNRTGRDSQL